MCLGLVWTGIQMDQKGGGGWGGEGGGNLNITVAGKRGSILTWRRNRGEPNGKIHGLQGSLKAQNLGGNCPAEKPRKRTWQRQRKVEPTEKCSSPTFFICAPDWPPVDPRWVIMWGKCWAFCFTFKRLRLMGDWLPLCAPAKDPLWSDLTGKSK